MKPQSKLWKLIPQQSCGVLNPPTSLGLFDLQISVRSASEICIWSPTLFNGEKQRVAVARAIAGGARLIIADEPTGSLETQQGMKIVEFGKTIGINESRINKLLEPFLKKQDEVENLVNKSFLDDETKKQYISHYNERLMMLNSR